MGIVIKSLINLGVEAPAQLNWQCWLIVNRQAGRQPS
jgi:hypothetical protein